MFAIHFICPQTTKSMIKWLKCLKHELSLCALSWSSKRLCHLKGLERLTCIFHMLPKRYETLGSLGLSITRKSFKESSISVMGYTYKVRNLNQTRCAQLALSGLSDSYNGPKEAQINILSNVMIKQFLCVMHSRKSWGFDLELFLIYPPSSLLRYSNSSGSNGSFGYTNQTLVEQEKDWSYIQHTHVSL